MDIYREKEALGYEPEATNGFKAVFGRRKGSNIEHVEHRAISLKELRLVYDMVKNRCENEGWVDINGNKLAQETVTFYDVVKYIIEPLTVKSKCSFVEMMGAKARRVYWFVSGWWGEPVCSFIKCLEQHVVDHILDESSTYYWVDGYVINQWNLGHSDTLENSAFYRAVRKSKGTISILDNRGLIFSRMWTVLELYLTLLSNSNSERSAWCIYTFNGYEAVGLTEGNAPADALPGAKWHREKRFPSELIHGVLSIDIEDARTSVPEDRENILTFIGSRDMRKLNLTVKSRFATAGLRIMLENDYEMMWFHCLQVIKDSKAETHSFDFSDCRQFTQSKRQQLRNHLSWDSLKNLSLNFSKLGLRDNGVMSIVKHWLLFDKILDLALTNNNIGDEGARKLAAALKKSSTLISLDLGWNNIGNEGARELATALKENATLTSLNLAGNSIGVEGAKDFATALKKNSTLTELRLDNDNVGDKLKKTIKDLLTENRKRSENDVAELKLAIQQALKDGTETEYRRVKLMTVGKGRSGKTCVIRSLLGESFDENTASTEVLDAHSRVDVRRAHDWKRNQDENLFGNDFADKAIEVGRRVQLQGTKSKSEKQEPKSKKAMSKKKAVSKQGITKANKLASSALGAIENKSSNEGKTLSNTEINEKFSKETILASQAYGARKGITQEPITFSIWDFGGQEVFKTLHHIFLTEYGIYLVVFNLLDVLEEEENALKDLCFWLSSIELHTRSAPIILIGTHYDKVQEEDLERINVILLKKEEVEESDLVENDMKKLCFFPLDNTNQTDEKEEQIKLIREKIEATAREQGFKMINAVRLYFMDLLLSENKPYLTFENVVSMAKGCGVEENNVKEILRFFHTRGIILFFEETAELSRLVILKPQWLVLALSRVIHDPHLHKYLGQRIKRERKDLKKDYKEYKSEGIVSHALLRFMWAEERFRDEFEYLESFMENALLLSPWGVERGSETEKMYYVPSFLNNQIERHIEPKSVGTRYDFFIQFKTILPPGVYERLLCMCINESANIPLTETPLREDEKHIVTFGEDGDVVLEMSCSLIHKRIHFSIVNGQRQFGFTIPEQIGKLLEQIKNSFFGGKLEWEILLHGEDGIETKSFGRLKRVYGKAKRRLSHPDYQTFNHWFKVDTEDVPEPEVREDTKRIQNMLEELVQKQETCPHMFILRKTKSRSFLRNYHYVIPVCAYDHQPVEGCGKFKRGYLVSFKKGFIQRNARTLFFAARLCDVVEVAVEASSGVPVDKIKKILAKTLGSNAYSGLENEFQELLEQSQSGEYISVEDDDYYRLLDIFSRPDGKNFEENWQKYLPMAKVTNRNDNVGWVRKQNKKKWKKSRR